MQAGFRDDAGLQSSRCSLMQVCFSGDASSCPVLVSSPVAFPLDVSFSDLFDEMLVFYM